MKMSKSKKTIKSLADLGKIVDKTKLKPAEAVQSSNPGTVLQKLTHDNYEELLNNEQEQGHNPNPFDFVFFRENPMTFTLGELDNRDILQSGYLEVQVKARSPVHIIGRQDPVNNRAGRKIQKSHFYIQDGQPCIPGSSIRGMLRAFIEAVTNGWVSQANDTYPLIERNKSVRHIKFASWDTEGHNHKCLNSPSGLDHTASPAIPVAFRPSLSGNRVDIATYLFGYVDENASARAGRMIIEDACFDNSVLKNYTMVDIEEDAIMGGPRPRANWWYMRPREVWDRSVRIRNRNGGIIRSTNVAHIVGDEFWGRKFYYHQDPEKCIDYYRTHWNVYPYDISCLDRDKTVTFRIYLERVPERLIKLLSTCLCMPDGSKMRHKLGYGRAFGYGSVEFSITSAMLRVERQASFPEPLQSMPAGDFVKSWTDDEIKDFIDAPSLNKLAQILTWDSNDEITFIYPPYNEENFKKVIQADRFSSNVPTARISLHFPKNPVSENHAIGVARALWGIKKPLHFQLYQARAGGYDKIKSRNP
jgi:CRISPR/Cas system CSM-associated protein Csm3 (group 7 of RAMP superfamily)